jgi:phenylalanyl-tRNA synthetase alpha chain
LRFYFGIDFYSYFSGEWKKANFKKYNFDALGIPPSGGHLHPLMKIREELRQIFFEMG